MFQQLFTSQFHRIFKCFLGVSLLWGLMVVGLMGQERGDEVFEIDSTDASKTLSDSTEIVEITEIEAVGAAVKENYNFFEDYGLILLPVSVRETLPANFFSDTFLSYRLSALLTHTLPQSVYQLESTGAFSFIDGELYSLYGNSWLWNRTYYNNIETTSAFFSGRSLHKILPIGHTVTFDGLRGTRNYIPESTYQDFTYLGAPIGNIGPHIPYYLVNERFTNIHKAAQIREVDGEIVAPEGNSGSLGAFEGFHRTHFSLSNPKLTSTDSAANSHPFSNLFVLDIFYHIGERKIAQFDYTGWDGTYNELAGAITVSGQVRDWTAAVFPNLSWDIGFISSFSARQHSGAEFRLREEETLGLNSFALTGYARSYGKQFTGTYTLSLATHSLLNNNPNNLAYNVVRLTGEGLEPFDTVPGTVVEITPQFNYDYTLPVYKNDFLKLVGETRIAIIATVPEDRTAYQSVYFQDTNATYSLYQSTYTQLPTTYALLIEELKLSINNDLERWWNVSVGFDLDGLLLSGESALRVTPAFQIEVLPVRAKWIEIGFFMGRENIPFTSEYAKFLSDNYRSVENYVWNDSNSNLQVDGNEIDEGTLYSRSGGQYQSLSQNFNQPHYYYIDIPLTFYLVPSKTWTYSLGGHYRIFKQAPWVCFEGDALDYGEYRDVNGTNVYFQTNGNVAYEICNLPETYFPSSNRSWFNNSPMYAGTTMGFNGIGKRFIFSLTFSAYLINGITRQGQGLVHNSLGFFERTMADPNNLVRPVGRYDADRSYLVRVLGSYAFLDNFIAAFTLSYRDGQPIGAWDYFLDTNGNGTQVAWIRNEVSGDNLLLYNGEFGTREDARWNIDVRFKWIFNLRQDKKLEMHLNIYNLVDLALETLEYSLYSELASNRIALETEPPRSLEIVFKSFY